MLSEVPEDWRTKPFAEFCEIKAGFGFPVKLQGRAEGDFPFYKVGDMNSSGNEQFMSIANHYVTKADLPVLKAKPYPAGAVIFPKIGAAIKTNKKRRLTRESLIDNNVMALIAKENVVTPDYLFRIMERTDIYQFSSQNGLPSINKSTIAKAEVLIPPLNEQHRIAEILSSVDASIQATQAVIEQAERVKRGLMEELLTGGLGSEAIERGEVPEGWRKVPLSDVLEVMRNGFSCKQEKSPLEGYVPVSRIETISTGFIDATRVGYVPYEEKLERYKIHKGDILFSHINSIEHIAKIAFAEDAQSFFHAMNLLLLRADSRKIIPFYLAEVLRWGRTRLYFREHCKRAVNQVSLNQKNIGGYEFPLPSVEEQQRIAEILLSADDFIAKQKSIVEQQNLTKRGLMDDLLTGKVRTV